jgi:hypothetical protein
VQSVDFFSNLKNSPDTSFGKMFYEKAIPSQSPIFRPYGGNKDFPMNKQMYNLTESINENKSYSQIIGKNYLGKSGQNLFDFQYTKENAEGVTGDYFRVLLLNREDSINNVGEFLSDYYSTIKLVNSNDIALQLVNIVSGAISINGEIGIGEISNQSQFAIIAQRILGLCFDSRQEIDVSGTAKIAELDGVDDSFFELTEVDLRNIDIEISNIQNGVMEFVDCENVKLPVDTESIVSQLIDFNDSLDTLSPEQQVNSISSILNSISQNPQWSPLLPSNFNAGVAIDKNIIKNLSFVQHCDLLIGSDSVFKTMASMIKIPTIVLHQNTRNNFRDRVFIKPYLKNHMMHVYKYNNFSKQEIKFALHYVLNILSIKFNSH